jgi:hypothetical protein
MSVTTKGRTYDELRAEHRWNVPVRYNIAADVCDKHPRDKLAMVWESFDGSYREFAPSSSTTFTSSGRESSASSNRSSGTRRVISRSSQARSACPSACAASS